ncbi:MAG TPA: ABC transporter permease, partial [Isosphaeraceae bacterium]|nr:ABC transporter permease [Isosphaeraceae bacterium]
MPGEADRLNTVPTPDLRRRQGATNSLFLGAAPTRRLDLTTPPALFRTAVISALIAVVTGIIFGAYPARRAAMLDPV